MLAHDEERIGRAPLTVAPTRGVCSYVVIGHPGSLARLEWRPSKGKARPAPIPALSKVRRLSGNILGPPKEPRAEREVYFDPSRSGNRSPVKGAQRRCLWLAHRVNSRKRALGSKWTQARIALYGYTALA